MLQKTSMMFLLILSFFAAAAAQTPHVSHGAGGAADGMAFYSISEMKWKDGPGSLAAGAKFAVLEGDPTKEGLFVMRLLLPDGFKVAPHWHPMVERVTVLQGTFYLGTGEKFDMSAGREMPAGTYGHWPAGMKHFAWVKGQTILQVHGTGPWVLNYVNPADDPRNAVKK